MRTCLQERRVPAEAVLEFVTEWARSALGGFSGPGQWPAALKAVFEESAEKAADTASINRVCAEQQELSVEARAPSE